MSFTYHFLFKGYDCSNQKSHCWTQNKKKSTYLKEINGVRTVKEKIKKTHLKDCKNDTRNADVQQVIFQKVFN